MTGPGITRLDAELVAFLSGPVAMVLATSDAAGFPTLVRAYNARMSECGGRLRVFIPAMHAEQSCQDLRANPKVAVVFSRISDFRTYQIKGLDCRLEGEPTKGDPALSEYLRGFAAEVTQVGVPLTVAQGMTYSRYQELSFSPSLAFQQTPGPSAGLAYTGAGPA